MIQKGNICLLKGTEVEPVDLIIGGSPCQNKSISGNGKGLEGDESIYGCYGRRMTMLNNTRTAEPDRVYLPRQNPTVIHLECNMQFQAPRKTQKGRS